MLDMFRQAHGIVNRIVSLPWIRSPTTIVSLYAEPMPRTRLVPGATW